MTVTQNALATLRYAVDNGFGRELKTGNFNTAVEAVHNCQPHRIKLYADGDIKDGWHFLNAIVHLINLGEMSKETLIAVDICD